MPSFKSRQQFSDELDARGIEGDVRAQQMQEYEAARAQAEAQGVTINEEPGMLSRAGSAAMSVAGDVGGAVAERAGDMGTGLAERASNLYQVGAPALRELQRRYFEEPGRGMASVAEIDLLGLGASPGVASTGGALAGGAVEYAPSMIPIGGAQMAGGRALMKAPGVAGALKRMAVSGLGLGTYDAGTEALRQGAGETPPSAGAIAGHGLHGAALGAAGHGVLGEALPAAAGAIDRVAGRAIGRPLRSAGEAVLERLRGRPAPEPLVKPPMPPDFVPPPTSPAEQAIRDAMAQGTPEGALAAEMRGVTPKPPTPPPPAPGEPLRAPSGGPEVPMPPPGQPQPPGRLALPPPGETVPRGSTEIPSGPPIAGQPPPPESPLDRIGQMVRQERPRPVMTREYGRSGEPLNAREVLPEGTPGTPISPELQARLFGPEQPFDRPLEAPIFGETPLPYSGRLLPPPRGGLAPGEPTAGPPVFRRPIEPLPSRAPGGAARPAPPPPTNGRAGPLKPRKAAVRAAEPEPTLDRPKEKLTFQQFYEGRTGKPYEPAAAARDPLTNVLKAEYEQDIVSVPKTYQQELRQAIAESDYVAKTGKNRAGKSLPPEMREQAQRQATEWRERLKAVEKAEGKETQAPAPSAPRPSVYAPTREELKAAGERRAALERMAPKPTPRPTPPKAVAKPLEAPVGAKPVGKPAPKPEKGVSPPVPAGELAAPLTFKRDRGRYKPGYSATAARASEAKAAKVAKDVGGVVEVGTVETPGRGPGARSPMAWVRKDDAIYDPLDGRWVAEDLFELRRKHRVGPATEVKPVKRGAVGKKGKAVVEGHTEKVDFEYELVPRQQPIVSHDAQGKKNAAFDQELQRRVREKKGSVQRRQDIREALDPDQLSINPRASDGAPILGPDDMTESGNLRMGAMQDLARDSKQLTGYRAFLKKHAAEYGLTPEQVTAAGDAVLVRRRMQALPPKQRAQLAADMNIPSVSEFTGVEQAMADAAKMDPDVVLKMGTPRGDDPLGQAEAAEFLSTFGARVVPKSQQGAYFADKGVTTKGQKRAQDAIFAYVYGGDNPKARLPLLERAIDSTKPGIQSIVTGLRRAAPRLAKLKARAEAGEGHAQYDISDDIARAVGTVMEMDQKKISLETWMNSEDLLSPISAEQRAMVEILHQGKKSSKALSEVLEKFADVMDAQPRPGEEGGLFGKIDPVSPSDMLRMAHGMRNLGQTVEEAMADLGRQKHLNAMAQNLRGQAAAHRARGDFDLAKTLEAQAELTRQGKKVPRGGVGLSKEEVDAEFRKLLKKAGPNLDDTAIQQAIRDTSYAMKMRIFTPDFAVRTHKTALGIVRMLQEAKAKEGRLKRIFVTNRPAKKQSKLKGRPLEGMTPRERRLAAQVTRPGIESVWQSLPRGQREAYKKARVAIDAMEEPFELTNEALAKFGLNEAGAEVLRQTKNLYKDVLPRLVNPLLKSLGKAPVKGRTNYLLPHKWMGQWELIGENGKPIVTPRGSTFETEAAVYAMAEQLLKASPGAKFTVRPSYRRMEMMQELPGDAETKALDRLLRWFEKHDTVPSTEIADYLRKNKSVRGIAAHMQQRKGAEGFDVADMEKLDHAYFSQLARWWPMRQARETIERIMMGTDLPKDLAGLSPDVAALLKDLPRMRLSRFEEPKLYAGIDQLMKDIFGAQRPSERMIDDVLSVFRRVPGLGKLIPGEMPARTTVRFARAVEAQLKLGLVNPGFFLVNSSQFITHATPLLGAKYAAKGAMGSMQAFFFPGSKAAKILRRYEKLGAVEPFFIEGEAGTALRHRLEKLSFFTGTLAEKMNRRATLLGAHYAFEGQGKVASRLMKLTTDFAQKHAKALDRQTTESLAMRFSNLVNFGYDVSYRPSMFRGPVGELVGQFRMFPLSTVQLWARMGQLAGKGDPAPMITHFATLFGLAGILGFPFFRTIDSFYRLINPDGVSPADWLLDQQIPQHYLRGTPALMEVDASRRVGYGDLLPEDVPDLLGPVVGTIADTFTRLIQRDFDAIFRETATGPGDWLYPLIADSRDKGVPEHNERKRLRYIPTATDRRVKALGFRPLIEAELADRDRVTSRKVQRYSRARGHFVDRAIETINELQGADRIEALQAIYREARENKTPITPKDVKDEMAKKRTPRILRTPKQVPKRLRPEYLQQTQPMRAEQLRRLEALRRAGGQP